MVTDEEISGTGVDVRYQPSISPHVMFEFIGVGVGLSVGVGVGIGVGTGIFGGK